MGMAATVVGLHSDRLSDCTSTANNFQNVALIVLIAKVVQLGEGLAVCESATFIRGEYITAWSETMLDQFTCGTESIAGCFMWVPEFYT